MSEQALRLINECHEQQNPYLDLGRCALRDKDVATGSPVDIALRTCTHLESLVLSTDWWGFNNGPQKRTRNKGKSNNLSMLPPAIAALPRLSSFVCGGTDKTPWDIRDMSLLSGITSLRYLDLSHNKIEFISGLDNLTGLTELTLSNNQIKEIRGLHALTALRRLDLAQNFIPEIKGLETLVNLQHLHLYHNHITELKGLSTLTNLQQLLLWQNQITALKGLETLTALQVLHLANNLITELKGLETLVHLRDLDLSHNQIAALTGLETLTALRKLNLSSNQIPEIKGLDTLTALRHLFLFSNRIQEIKGLSTLTALERLHLSINQIPEIKGLETLTALDYLNLSSNRITELKGLAQLTNLTELHIESNQITELKGLETLNALQKLKFVLNQVTELKGLDTLTNLEELEANYNKITAIKGLDKLKNLSIVRLGSNQIKDIASLLPLIQKDQPLRIRTDDDIYDREGVIDISKNPLVRPTIETVKQGNQAIINYFKELEKQGADYLYEAKLLIVGQPRAGKTSLRYKLFDSNARLPEEDKTTRGIDIDRVSFDIKDQEGNIRQFHYNVWDFGGQQIYQTTHQFFLTHRSLYVLVVDTGKDSIGNDDATVNYWLQAVELLGGNSPLLLVQNEKNERKIHLDLPQKKARFTFLKESYQVDLNALTTGTTAFNQQRKKDFDQLKRDIETTLSRLPLVGFPMPRNWVKIREELQALSATTAYINLDKYREICSRHEVTETERQLELSRIFHDLGVFLHFQDYGILEDFIVLQNTWATDAVFAVLDNATVRANNGRFTDHDLPAIWESKGYGKEVQRKLLGLMIQFELCYQVDKTKPFTYIVPEMLPDIAPGSYVWQPHHDLPLQYRYDFMPRGLLTRLIVRLNRNIYAANGTQSVWKTGVKIDGNLMDCPNTYAEITEAWDNRQLSIRVHGRFSKDLMSKITYEIDELNKDYFKQINHVNQEQKSRWYKMIPCNCVTCKESDEKHFYDYSKLLARQEYGKDTIECEKQPFATVAIRELMEGVFSKGKRAFPGNGQSEPKKIFISYSKNDLALVNTFIKHLAALQLDGKVTHWYCTELTAGTDWHTEIQEHFDQSDIVCFMVSPNFMSTAYIHEHEIKKAFERKEKDPAFKIVPIILDFCKWTTSHNNLGQFTALPYTAKPVVDFKNQHMAWYIIQECLRLMIEKDLNPTGEGFYTTQALPKDVLNLLERIVAGKADA